MQDSIDLQKSSETDLASVIANIVALGATLAFAIVAARTFPIALGLGELSAEGAKSNLQALVLSLALIILAWLRVSELRRSKQKLREAEVEQHRLAFVDEASGLHNRRYLVDVIFPRLAAQAHAILLLDLDGFKKVNDLHGHAQGDLLLREVGKRMHEIAPDDAEFARLGGDEFAICLVGPAASKGAATRLAAKLVEAIDQPFNLGNVVARISGSVGIAHVADCDTSPAESLHRADIAMYEAKRAGRNRYTSFDEGMERELIERNQLEADIRRGVEQGEFVPFFQPLLSLETSTLKGFEVLARWNHPTNGLVMPDQFIPIAEANGMIAELSMGVMRAALLQASEWDGELTLAVNVSPVQFRDPLLPDRIAALLKDVDFPAARLELEITETAILEDKTTTLKIINRLRAMGIRISLDDFGTGYASLSQLRELPFDRIKIDKSFVSSLIEDRQSDAIVEAITAMGRSMSLPITAEGVENEFAQDLLAGLGCTDAQGWLYGKAMSAVDVARIYYGQPDIVEASSASIDVPKPSAERRSYARRGR